MNELGIFLIIIAISGFYSSRQWTKLAPWHNELPLKTIVATLLASFVAYLFWSNQKPTQALQLVSLIFGIIYIFGPFLVTLIARRRLYSGAKQLANGLYWTSEGRQAIKRLIAQVALQKSDASEALAIAEDLPDNTLIRLQAYALEQKWNDVLLMPVPESGDNAFLAMSARIKAFLELNEVESAELEYSRMQKRFEKEQGPIAFRSVTLSEARLIAERGDFNKVRDLLSQPLPHVHPFQTLEILANAAENGGQRQIATQLYSQAYRYAPKGLRETFANKLQLFGAAIPDIPKPKRPLGTYGLAAFIVLCWLSQMFIDNQLGPNVSFAIAAFFLNIPGIPESDAYWRYLSYGLLHGGWLHFGMNTYVLFDIGRLYEARRHWGNVLASFVLGTIFGAYITSIFQASDQLTLVGASGGVLGVGGALLADAWLDPQRRDSRLMNSLLQWVAMIVIFSLAIPNVSLWGHVGGLVGGLLWGLIRQGLPKEQAIDKLAGYTSMGLIAAAVAMAFRWFMQYN